MKCEDMNLVLKNVIEQPVSLTKDDEGGRERGLRGRALALAEDETQVQTVTWHGNPIGPVLFPNRARTRRQGRR
jgi:hypothetical protein